MATKKAKAVKVPFRPVALRDLFESVEAVASRDKTRAALECVRLEVDGNDLRAIATDGHRLHSAVLRGGAMPDLDGVMLDPKSRTALRKAIKKTRGGASRLYVRRKGDRIVFETGSENPLVPRAVIDADWHDRPPFPHWRQIVPASKALHGPVTMPAGAAGAFETMASVNEDGFVRVAFGKKGLDLTSHRTHGPAEIHGKAHLKVDRVEKRLDMGVNGRYMADALRAVGLIVRFPKIVHSEGPIFLGEVGGDFAVVMPARL